MNQSANLRECCYLSVKIQTFVKMWIYSSKICRSVSLSDAIPLLFHWKVFLLEAGRINVAFLV